MKKVEWVSYIELTSKIEAEIESCFSCDVEFHHPIELEQFEGQLEDFKACSNTAKVNEDTYSSEDNIVNKLTLSNSNPKGEIFFSNYREIRVVESLSYSNFQF